MKGGNILHSHEQSLYLSDVISVYITACCLFSSLVMRLLQWYILLCRRNPSKAEITTELVQQDVVKLTFPKPCQCQEASLFHYKTK